MGELSPELQARIEVVKGCADLAGLIGRSVKLRRTGREWTGLCPFHDERTPSFTVASEKGFYHCFGCGAHGDALKWLQDHDGLPFLDALRELEALAGISGVEHQGRSVARPAPTKRPSRRAEDDGDTTISSMEAAVVVWQRARSARGTIVETYLRSRHIDPRVAGLLGVVRFLPQCPVSLWKRDGMPGLMAPAMLAPICHVEGEPGARVFVQQGVHVTFIAPDGEGKAQLPPWHDREGKVRKRPTRKIWGEAAQGCVPIPPLLWKDWRAGEWLDLPNELIVGEGIETTHSLMERVAASCAVRGGLATLSLGNLQGHWIEDGPKLDAAPSLPLWNLRGDPNRVAFTVPQPGTVAIGVDADMKGLPNRRVQERPRTKPLRRDLTGEERMGICGQLAAQAWKRAGATRARVLRPRMGCDFNDEAREARHG